jgi:CBS domain-containing protein
LENLYHHDFTQCDYICITDDDDTILGILSSSDLHSLIDPSLMMKNREIGKFIFRKIPKFLDVIINIEFAFQLVCERTDDAVVIVDDDKPVGIFSTQDALRLLVKGYDSDRPIGSYMSSPIHLFNNKSSIYDGLEFLSYHNHRRLVVVDDNQTLLGVVSKRELTSFFQLGWAEMMKHQEKKLITLNKELEGKNKQLEYTASHDTLTGIYNRRHFDELLKREIAYERRYKTHTGFLMLDIDHFKSVNDTFGHNMGDEILVEFSRVVQTTLREVDIFGR